jgi:Protein of unknown function (DUF3043)
VFRRRASDAPDVLDQGQEAEPETGAPPRPGVTAAKGRPTPRRSESERQRRQPYSAPGDRKAAAGAGRDRDKAQRARKMEAMRRGEEWALNPRDKGPVRALARDVVDARRGLSEYYLVGIVVLIAALFIPGLRQTAFLDIAVLVVLLVVTVEGYLVSGKVMRLARERFPGESTRGIRMYTALRGTQLRGMRTPAPRVQRGARV